MKLLGKQRIDRFKRKHSTSRKRLNNWMQVVEEADWERLIDIQQTYRDTEYVPGKDRYVFNVGGNEFRVIAKITFPARLVLVTDVLTHQEYDRW
tara:strand:- start:211 stop:492 length:282 start_codon:yes stop_codon:yes gene_type:complete